MSEEIKDTTATATDAQQDNTTSDVVVDGADTKESTLLDSQPNEDTQTESKPEEKAEESGKSDLLGDIEQQDKVAPESYEPFTTADGKEMDEQDMEILSELAKAHNLSQEDAQKAALVANDLMSKLAASQEEAMAKVIAENTAEWKRQDPTGEKTLLARKAVERRGPEFHQHLKDNGYLNDWRIMSLLADEGRNISEGKSISGKPAMQQSLLYPNTPELYNNS